MKSKQMKSKAEVLANTDKVPSGVNAAALVKLQAKKKTDASGAMSGVDFGNGQSILGSKSPIGG